MKKNLTKNLVLSFMVMALSVHISFARPNADEKYWRCLTYGSETGNCTNGTPLIHGSCGLFYGSDPCNKSWFYIDSEGNYKKAGCCSAALSKAGNGSPDPEDIVIELNNALSVNTGYGAYNLVASNGEIRDIPVFNFEYMVGEDWDIAQVNIVSHLDGVMIYVGNPDSLVGQYLNIDSVFVPSSLIEVNYYNAISNWSQSYLPNNNKEIPSNEIFFGIPKEILNVIPKNTNWNNVHLSLDDERIEVIQDNKSKFIEIEKAYLQVFDLQGNVVHQTYLKNNEEQIIDLSHLRHGMYIFFCEINGIPIRKKVFKYN